MIYEESGDGIVPSTPTLYVPRRGDGFSEAVSSPQPQVCISAPFVSNFISVLLFFEKNITWNFVSFNQIHSQQHQQPMARFTFAESARPTEGIDDTRIDLTSGND